MVLSLGTKVIVKAGSFAVVNKLISDPAGGPDTIEVDMIAIKEFFEGEIIDIDWMVDMRSPMMHTKIRNLVTNECFIFFDTAILNRDYLVAFDGRPIA